MSQKIIPKFLITKLSHCYSIPLKATSGSSGYDLFAANYEDIILKPGNTALVPTGIKIDLDTDKDILYEAQIRSRSGMSAKNSVVVLNSPGTIDADYKGEIFVILINHHKTEDFIIKRGARIAQLVIQPIFATQIYCEIDNLNDDLGSNNSNFNNFKIRGSGGFGSTGE
ncbi:MAG: dUTP diphosphatase [Rickettsiales bacterium]